VKDAHLKARRTYVPQVYPHRITFFWSSVKQRDPNPRSGWSRLTTEETETYIVPGDHRSMSREPHAQVLAEKLRACLDKAQTND
jgi:thioesterase domain-containing protein